jgi:flagellar biosynthesis chaperone FliJ
MRAVARVRELRERDSRLGLQQAAAEEQAQARRLLDLEARIADAARAGQGSTDDFRRARQHLSLLGELAVGTERALASAETVTAAAMSHWQADRTRLGAVELLLDRRARDRADTDLREEHRRLDEVATLHWQRQQTLRDGGAA